MQHALSSRRVAPPLGARRPRGSSSRAAAATRAAAPQRRHENVDGEFYVDSRCIDCDVCRWLAPSTFVRVNGLSAVVAQPEEPEARLRSLQAMLACPTASIHTAKPPSDITSVHQTFPMAISGSPGVYYLGYHSPKSFGASSYLILRPEGNVMVDSPRFAAPLVRQLEEWGGVQGIFLTHQDDVADAALWASHFNATRIIHEADVTAATRDAEHVLRGVGPWQLPPSCDAAVPGGTHLHGRDISILHVPGHTAGSCALLHAPSRTLFTGDTLAHSAGLGRLTMFRRFNWHSVEQQLDSIRGLQALDFLHVLPGHGRRVCFESLGAKNAALAHLLAEEGAPQQQNAR